MLITVLDGNGIPQQIIVSAQEDPLDAGFSNSIAATGVAQVLLNGNNSRSGYIMQNISANPMHLSDTGAATSGIGSFLIAPGAYFPPPNYPTAIGAISILGTIGDLYTVREW